MVLERILDVACAEDASDIHLRAGMPPALRVDGVVEVLAHELLSEDDLLSFLSRVVTKEGLDAFLARREIDGAFSTSHGRWRLHAYHSERGAGVALRRLPKVVPSLDELGLPSVVRDLVTREQGLILVTGATGSGKSTSAAAMLSLIGHSRSSHIVTIEDPIEYLFDLPRGIVSQREVGKHTCSFAQALRAALREDPDVIFVGEMRDLETTRLALQAAETGHLVISTLHTGGAAKTVSRIVDVFPAEQQSLVRAILAETVEAIISQELIPTSLGKRVLVPEVLIGTPAARALIRDGKFHQIEHLMHTSLDVGMQTRARAVETLRRAGLVNSD